MRTGSNVAKKQNFQKNVKFSKNQKSQKSQKSSKIHFFIFFCFFATFEPVHIIYDPRMLRPKLKKRNQNMKHNRKRTKI